MFVRTGTNWAEESTIVASGGAGGDSFGWVALSSDGGGALVSAPYDDTAGGMNAGSARVFLRSGTSWAEAATLLASSGAADDLFGWSVALSSDGSRALVGAMADDTAGGSDAGSARVFTIVPADPNGTTCASGITCLSGFCVDGVCCESACTGGSSDCQACSAVLTSGTDGICAALSPAVAPTVTCRSTAGVCDPAEVCSPASTTCPADVLAPATTVCRPVASTCDAAAERCTETPTTVSRAIRCSRSTTGNKAPSPKSASESTSTPISTSTSVKPARVRTFITPAKVVLFVPLMA